MKLYIICSNIIWSLKSPCLLLCNCRKYVYDKYPKPQLLKNSKDILYSSGSSDVSRINKNDVEKDIILYDFWGPCLVMSVYGAILWFSKVNHVALLYLIWLIAAVGSHLICRVWCQFSTISMHLSLLGYSVTPVSSHASLSIC